METSVKVIILMDEKENIIISDEENRGFQIEANNKTVKANEIFEIFKNNRDKEMKFEIQNNSGKSSNDEVLNMFKNFLEDIYSDINS